MARFAAYHRGVDLRAKAGKGRWKNKRVGVLMGGVSEEREISLMTGNDVLGALLHEGVDAVGIDAGPDVAVKLKELGVEVAFIALHGTFGEDGCVQGALELMGIPYTGSGVLASAIAMDKAMSKRVFACAGVPTPAFRVVGPGDGAGGLKLPLVVKPAGQGSAIGVTVVEKRAGLERAVRAAARHGGTVMVEEFVKGRELTVGILGETVLPVIEIIPKKGFYDYKNKYTKGLTEFIAPARINKRTEARVVKCSIAAFRSLGCRGAARVDGSRGGTRSGHARARRDLVPRGAPVHGGDLCLMRANPQLIRANARNRKPAPDGRSKMRTARRSDGVRL